MLSRLSLFMKVTKINTDNPMPTTIDFYFDFSSSYSYIALPGISRLADSYDVEVSWKPIVLGFIFKTLNHAPPAADSVKGRYVFHDVERSARIAGLPFRWPQPFPFNSLTASRVFWYLAGADSNKAVEWARSVFHASFGEGRDCSNPEVLGEVAAGLGHDAVELLEATANDDVKAMLKAVTGEATERGVFGAPTFFVGDEMFWGNDRLLQLERHIGDE